MGLKGKPARLTLSKAQLGLALALAGSLALLIIGSGPARLAPIVLLSGGGGGGGGAGNGAAGALPPLALEDLVLGAFEEFEDDKRKHPAYSRMYSKILRGAILAKAPLDMLEIGAGCVNEFSYANQKGVYSPGRSVRVWKKLLPRARVAVADIDACAHRIHEDGVLPSSDIFIGDQSDKAFLDRILAAKGRYDFIIDDGSHRSPHQIATFSHLFLHGLRPGGVYVIEDLESSFQGKFWNADSCAYMLMEASWGLTIAGRKVGNKIRDPDMVKHRFVVEVVPLIESVEWYEDAVVIQKKWA